MFFCFVFYFWMISLCYYICSSPLSHFGFKKKLFMVPYQYFIKYFKNMLYYVTNLNSSYATWGSDYQLLRGQEELNFVLQKEVLVLRCWLCILLIFMSSKPGRCLHWHFPLVKAYRKAFPLLVFKILWWVNSEIYK